MSTCCAARESAALSQLGACLAGGKRARESARTHQIAFAYFGIGIRATIGGRHSGRPATSGADDELARFRLSRACRLAPLLFTYQILEEPASLRLTKRVPSWQILPPTPICLARRQSSCAQADDPTNFSRACDARRARLGQRQKAVSLGCSQNVN